MKKSITIIGAGLAGSEVALQLAHNGWDVTVFDERPKGQNSYTMSAPAELVCESFLALNKTKHLTALVEELRQNGSKMIEIAQRCRLDGEGNFYVDKQKLINTTREEYDKVNIKLINSGFDKVPPIRPLVISTGPLTDNKFADSVSETFGFKKAYFHDYTGALVKLNSIDLKNPCIKKITNDLYEIHVSDGDFEHYAEALRNGVLPKHLQSHVSDSNMLNTNSIEKLAADSTDRLKTTRYFQKDGNTVILLHRVFDDNFMLNDSQSGLSNGSQKTAFQCLPGLENVEFLKYGRIERDTYFDAGGKIDMNNKIIGHEAYLAGAITGTTGYATCIASGFNVANGILTGKSFPRSTFIGALADYASREHINGYQPIEARFELLES
jgi:methylenetetrahydrofolate--tRNA-(uracil-5-)-methyltransferase